jgi:hypothetical protein
MRTGQLVRSRADHACCYYVLFQCGSAYKALKVEGRVEGLSRITLQTRVGHCIFYMHNGGVFHHHQSYAAGFRFWK